jgi:hypothetical protein
MIEKLKQMIEDSIIRQHDKIDACQANDLQENKLRAEGFLEALICVQLYIRDQMQSRD